MPNRRNTIVAEIAQVQVHQSAAQLPTRPTRDNPRRHTSMRTHQESSGELVESVCQVDNSRRDAHKNVLAAKKPPS
jgi:hypothetical protein